MRLGLDCPTSWLEYLQHYTDYDYVLVEKCLTDNTYLEYFKNSSKEKLLNNRLMGADIPRTIEDIKKVWDILGGMVIAPDWGNDHVRTLEGYVDICTHIGRENVIGVVQTLKDREIDECLETYGERVAVGFDVGSEHEDDEIDKMYKRVKGVQKLESKKVHLLGMTNPGELLFYKNLDYVETINTGLPLLLGFKGISLLKHRRVKDVSSYNYMDMENPEVDARIFDLVCKNIEELDMLL